MKNKKVLLIRHFFFITLQCCKLIDSFFFLLFGHLASNKKIFWHILDKAIGLGLSKDAIASFFFSIGQFYTSLKVRQLFDLYGRRLGALLQRSSKSIAAAAVVAKIHLQFSIENLRLVSDYQLQFRHQLHFFLIDGDDASEIIQCRSLLLLLLCLCRSASRELHTLCKIISGQFCNQNSRTFCKPGIPYHHHTLVAELAHRASQLAQLREK